MSHVSEQPQERQPQEPQPGEPGGPGTHPRISGPHNILNQSVRFDEAGQVAADDAASPHYPPGYTAGLSYRIIQSGDRLRQLIDEMRNHGVPGPAELRPLADGFRRHVAAANSTARDALEQHGPHIAQPVRRDREEGDQLVRMLDAMIAGAPPEGTYALTAGGVVADIDQYLVHERRDLIPLIDRELPLGESEHLAGRFND
ncbi:hypothetical protein [Streptomyces sp. CA-111067]|uniref:hypothetical protein n=1 Tax=Streptomyces sp. CA-111067 TaxID=3240046 RepID=UPI003D98D759